MLKRNAEIRRELGSAIPTGPNVISDMSFVIKTTMAKPDKDASKETINGYGIDISFEFDVDIPTGSDDGWRD